MEAEKKRGCRQDKIQSLYQRRRKDGSNADITFWYFDRIGIIKTFSCLRIPCGLYPGAAVEASSTKVGYVIRRHKVGGG